MTIPADQARQLAEELLLLLRPGCMTIKIAGSLRRKVRREVKDVELVIVPQFQPSLLPGVPGVPLTDGILYRMLEDGRLHRGSVDGPLHKSFRHPRLDLRYDLYYATPDNFGAIFAIRTGDADFSHAMVTNWRHAAPLPGFLPDSLRQDDGKLWRLLPGGGREEIVCRTEAAYFRALGLAQAPRPELRNRETATLLHELAVAEAEKAGAR